MENKNKTLLDNLYGSILLLLIGKHEGNKTFNGKNNFKKEMKILYYQYSLLLEQRNICNNTELAK